MKKLLLAIILTIHLQICDSLAAETGKKKGLIWMECIYRNVEPEHMFDLNDETAILSLDLRNKVAIRHGSLGEKEEYKVKISDEEKNILELTRERSKDVNSSEDKIGCRDLIAVSRYGYYRWSSNCKYLSRAYEGECKKINEPKPLF